VGDVSERGGSRSRVLFIECSREYSRQAPSAIARILQLKGAVAPNFRPPSAKVLRYRLE